MQQRQETSRGNPFGDGSSTQRLEDRIRSNSPLSGVQRYVHHIRWDHYSSRLSFL